MINLIADRFFVSEKPVSNFESVKYWPLVAVFVLGLLVRFWGLDKVGLHGDEEIMGLAVRGILDTGLPYHPSGMLYPRALSQLYLMSASVWLFGESEWALRLPSAIIGALCTFAAFAMGRRFLRPWSNLVFATIITFLPVMIEISQTARMYVFFVFGLMVFATIVFRWERTGRFTDLAIAVIVWLVVLDIHRLAVFALPIFLFPGLCRASTRQFFEGVGAAVISFLAFTLWSKWISDQYPSNEERPAVASLEEPQSPLQLLLADQALPLVVFALLGLAVIVGLGVIRSKNKQELIPAFALLASGYLSCVFLNYYVGLILVIVGAIELARHTRTKYVYSALIVSLVVLVLFQLSVLHSVGEYPGRKLIGAFVGTPSIWPTIKLAMFSPFAMLVYSAVAVYAAFKMANRVKIPDHFLFFVLAVWGPVFGIGLFMWNVPPRYTLGLLPFFLMCSVAGLQYWYHDRQSPVDSKVKASQLIAIGALFTVFSVNPVEFAKTVTGGYDRYPDHKGAAEFVKSLQLSDKDVVIAEDALQQFYYLGSVDYRLLNIDVARKFAFFKNGEAIYQYTGTPIIGTGEELAKLLAQEREGNVYIVGSGENFQDGRRLMRGRGIYEVLESGALEVLYVGRDGKTKVWKSKKQAVANSNDVEPIVS